MITTVEAKDFMVLLSKVLETASANDNDVSKSLRDLDKLLRNELPDALNVAGHPNAPALSAHCTTFQEVMELAVTSRRILNKPVVVLEGDSISQSLAYLKECAKSPIPVVCLNIDCGIPMVVVHGESPKIEAINYANSVVSLNLKEEFVRLLEGSRKYKVELGRVVKCFVLTIPLKTTAGTFMLLKKGTSNIFSRFIALRFLVATNAMPPKELTNLNSKYAGILCEKAGKQSDTGVKHMTARMFAQMMTEQISIPLYGLYEEFAWLSSDILNYFTASLHHSEKLIESLTDDLIRMESSFASADDKKKFDNTKQKTQFDIASLREEAETALDNTKDSLQHLKRLISNAKELVNTLLTALEAEITALRFTPDDVLEDVFKTFFNAVEADNSEYYNQAMVRLHTLGYADTVLMKKYIKSKNGSMKDVLDANEIFRRCDDLKSNDWAKAKMLIELLDVDNAPVGLLEKLICSMQGHIFTGKEFYALAIVESDLEQHKAYLWESLQRGYATAGKMLMGHIHGNDENALNTTKLLAQHLIPEACLTMGEIEFDNFMNAMESYMERGGAVTIDAPCMRYFKLAASQECNEALGRIADILFNTSFKEVFFVSKRPEEQRSILMNNAKIICWIANKLMEMRFNTAHFDEISGITLFCLNDRKFFAEARKRLASLKQRSPEASYCLGYMSEHGIGCTINYTSAIKYYKKALENGLMTANGEYVSKRLSATTQKLAKQFIDRMKSYNDNNDYSRSSNTSSHPSGGVTMVFLVALGLGYHSIALNEVRSFRDKKICCTSLGKQLVKEYYRIAPEIRQCIEHSKDPKGICENLWDNYVKDIQQSIRDGRTQDAIRELVDMQVDLCERYHLNYDESLINEYRHQNA